MILIFIVLHNCIVFSKQAPCFTLSPWRQCCDLLLHTVGNAREHARAARQHRIRVQILADVDVALHDAIVCGFMHTARLHA